MGSIWNGRQKQDTGKMDSSCMSSTRKKGKEAGAMWVD